MQGVEPKEGRTATRYDYGREGKLLRIEAGSHYHEGESQCFEKSSYIDYGPKALPAGGRGTKRRTTRIIKGPKATTSETKSRKPTTTPSQSPLSRTPPPRTPPPHSPPPPRNPLGTPETPPPPAHQTSPARSRHSPNSPQTLLSPATNTSAKRKIRKKGRLTRADNNSWLKATWA